MSRISSTCWTSTATRLSTRRNWSRSFAFFSGCWQKGKSISPSATSLISFDLHLLLFTIHSGTGQKWRSYLEGNSILFIQTVAQINVKQAWLQQFIANNYPLLRLLWRLVIIFILCSGSSMTMIGCARLYLFGFEMVLWRIYKSNNDLLLGMKGCHILLSIVLMLPLAAAILQEDKQAYSLAYNQSLIFSKIFSQPTRFLLLQFQGTAAVKITKQNGELVRNTHNTLQEITFDGQLIGEKLSFAIQGKSERSAGSIQFSAKTRFEQLSYRSQKGMVMNKREERILQIRPKEKGRLMIERMQGVPSFISNRCVISEREECVDQMHRFAPVELRRHVFSIQLDACDDCVIMMKISSASEKTRIRVSIDAQRTKLQGYPLLFLLKKDQIEEFYIFGKENQTGLIVSFQGLFSVNSSVLQVSPFQNGQSFKITALQGQSEQGERHKVSLKGIKTHNFIKVQNLQSDKISLIEGLPTTIFISNSSNYTIDYKHALRGKANIIFSADSSFLERLSIHCANPATSETHLIRPRFSFHSGAVSQTFQLEQHEDLTLSFHLASGDSGYLNISAEANSFITLPLDYVYSNTLAFNEADEFVVEGVSGSIEVEIDKCADCVISYEISKEFIRGVPREKMAGRSVTESINGVEEQLFIKVHTSNYAFYSLSVRKKQQSSSKEAVLVNSSVEIFLKESQAGDVLLMEFHAPTCSKHCEVKYFLLEGSNLHHLSSKVYCPSILFNYDEWEQDISVEPITPSMVDGVLSFERPLRQRDYIGVIAEVDGRRMAYTVVNTEEIKLYHSIRWTVFYIALFFTAAFFISFILFMALRRKQRVDEDGYVRVSANASSEHLG